VTLEEECDKWRQLADTWQGMTDAYRKLVLELLDVVKNQSRDIYALQARLDELTSDPIADDPRSEA
jgi:hypothetical protein